MRKKHQRVDLWKENKIAFLKKGSVSMYRLDNDIVTLSFDAPSILGLGQMLHEERFHYFRCVQDSDMVIIDQDAFMESLSIQGLWHHSFNILSFYLRMYFLREKRLVQKDVKSIVKENLQYIWSLGPEVRARTSVYTFILARNQVSRSSLHKIISLLTKDGMVKMERGKLLWLKEINGIRCDDSFSERNSAIDTLDIN
jgi:hypothetical protein